MSISVSWLIEEHIILTTTSESINVDDVISLVNQSREMIRDCPNPVYMIFDDTPLARQPSIATYRQAATQKVHENLRGVITIGEKNPVQRFVSLAASSLFGVKLYFCDDMDGALDFIYDQKPELNTIEPSLLNNL